MTAPVLLRTARGEFDYWTEIRINRSIEQTTGEFTLGITEKKYKELLKQELQANERCQVLIHGQTVIDGYLDLFEPSFDESTHTINVSGRDITGDMMESSAFLPDGELTNVTILQLAQTLLTGYGLALNCPAPGEPFEKAVVNGGESIFDVLSIHAGQRGLLLYTLGDGVLHIAKPPQMELHRKLIEGVDILRANAAHDITQQYGRYIFHGQGKDAQTVKYEIHDPTCRPTRLLVQDLELAEGSSLDLIQKRAEWELKVRRAKGKRATVTVQGWEYEPGKIWNVGQRPYLKSPRLGYDQLMLISTLTYTCNEQDGTLTELTLTDPEAYAPEPT